MVCLTRRSFIFQRLKTSSTATRRPGLQAICTILGALYSESGDYKQSSIYFNKALEITKQTRPELGEGIFAMSLNIASALKLSGYRDTAITLYKNYWLQVIHQRLR